METIKFTPPLATGIEEIDAEHRHLVECLNAVLQANQNSDEPERLMASLESLRDGTRTHFAQEEVVMRRLAYPALPAHRAQHDDLFAALRVLIDHFAESGEAQLSDETLVSLKAWLLDHIAIEDKKIGKFHDRNVA